MSRDSTCCRLSCTRFLCPLSTVAAGWYIVRLPDGMNTTHDVIVCRRMGHIHEVNLRDKTVAAMLIDNLRVHGELTNETGLYHLPFNTLHQW